MTLISVKVAYSDVSSSKMLTNDKIVIQNDVPSLSLILIFLILIQNDASHYMFIFVTFMTCLTPCIGHGSCINITSKSF